ncbi:D-ribose pyranase [Paenibacillus oleatilyticus]|uniref:D-ribose pyranase n=1 Tax=Paenibacillus oleatilyticus TaxID=2594886 RepID=UPI001C1F6B0D|nr:D-ribose pyranase [Paenibacillus oleatilyticus]MBU7314085.1 D-ribose pyranase [Paenibacillus oleatilyticus]
MKKIGIINSEISEVISKLGHTDTVVICDSGLPIPDHVRRIDLALKQGVPSLLETLSTVLEEMEVEAAFVADEMERASPRFQQELEAVMKGIPVRTVSHEQLKKLTHEAKAVIRTGEFTPYANIVLQAGVIF